MKQWYYVFSRDYSMAVLHYYRASPNDYMEEAERFLKKCEILDKVDYDTMGPFPTRRQALEDVLQRAKEEWQLNR